MNKKILTGIAVAAAVAAVVMSGFGLWSVSRSSVIVVSTDSGASVAAAVSVSDAAAEESDAEIDILLTSMKTLKIKNSTIILAYGDDAVAVELPEGSYESEYSAADGVFTTVTDDGLCEYVICTISADDVVSNSIYRFADTDGNTVIAAQKVVGGVGISVVGTALSEDAAETVTAWVQEVCAGTYAYSGTVKATVQDYEISADWINGIAVDGDAMLLTDGEDTVTISYYSGDIENAGFDNELEITGGPTVLYGDYADAETGYAPYMLSTSNGYLKIMATSADVLVALFAAGQ